MSQPSFISDGNTPRNTDTRYMRWLKILGALQNRAGALSPNNPRRDDTLRQIKVKILNAIRGTY